MKPSSGGDGPPPARARTDAGPDALFWDETLLLLPGRTRMTALGMWHQYVDQQGQGPADPVMVHEAIWPLSPDVSPDDVLDDLVLLGDAGWLDLLDAPDGQPFVQLRGWPSGVPTSSPPPAAPPRSTPGIGHLTQGVVEGEKEGRRGEEGAQAGAGAPPPSRPSGYVPMSATLAHIAGMPEPSPYCWKHQPFGAEEKCGPCGSARKRHELWVRATSMEAA